MRRLLLALLLAGPAAAQDDPAAQARAAARQFEEAAALLAAAETAEDRLNALAQAVRAHEEGLSLLREALRDLAAESRALEAGLAQDRETTTRLLAALQAMGAAPEAALLLHPEGALATARAGMLLAEVAPALEAETQSLRARLDALRAAEAAQAEAEAELETGLASVQEARAALAAAAASREPDARAFQEDPVATALLMASAASLEEVAAQLDATVAQRLGQGPASAPGGLPLPVAGAVTRDPARPGLLIAAEPRALVAVPVDATLRFRGPLLDLGTVAILEPAPGTLFVLSGLAQVWGEAGEILPAGAPLGLMGGDAPPAEGGASPDDGSTRGPDADSDAMVTVPPEPGSGGAAQTLYLEVRDADGPVDPGIWFELEGDTP